MDIKHLRKRNLLLFFHLTLIDITKYHYLIDWVLGDRNAALAANSFGRSLKGFSVQIMRIIAL
jgi:hypothetical protein